MNSHLFLPGKAQAVINRQRNAALEEVVPEILEEIRIENFQMANRRDHPATIRIVGRAEAKRSARQMPDLRN